MPLGLSQAATERYLSQGEAAALHTLLLDGLERKQLCNSFLFGAHRVISSMIKHFPFRRLAIGNSEHTQAISPLLDISQVLSGTPLASRKG